MTTTPSHHDRPAAGFTLIEVLIALTVFATGMLAMALTIPMATDRVMSAGTQTRASSIASETAEELLTEPFGSGTISEGTHDDPANPHDGLYHVRWVVEDDAPSDDCKRITVTVARRSPSAAPEARLVIVTARSGG